MAACLTSTAVNLGWLTPLGTVIFDYQTLITGFMAIGAALYAGAPVWRQLRDSNLQTRIQHRATLAILLREAQDRFASVESALQKPLSDLDYVTSDPLGEPMPISTEDAHHYEQSLSGIVDWYLSGLKDTELPEIESGKRRLKTALDDLRSTLHDAHWVAHNDQHDEDHSISDEEWAALIVRSNEAEILAASKVAEARSALRALRIEQNRWFSDLRSQISRLDLLIANADRPAAPSQI